jgi:hypothetical protein
MRVLSIDPGYTTGIAVYDENGELEVSMAASRLGLFGNGFLTGLIKMSHPDVVLIEAIPTHHIDPETMKIHSHLTQWFTVAGFAVYSIRPAEWKGMVPRVEIPGQHARDAATMAMWWIRKNK